MLCQLSRPCLSSSFTVPCRSVCERSYRTVFLHLQIHEHFHIWLLKWKPETDTAEVTEEVRRERPSDASRWSDGGREKRRSSKSRHHMLKACSREADFTLHHIWISAFTPDRIEEEKKEKRELKFHFNWFMICLLYRMVPFLVNQWRRMKTPGEGTGVTRLSLCSPAWAMLWAWATSGDFPTSATETAEVRTHVRLICLYAVWCVFRMQPAAANDDARLQLHSCSTETHFQLWSIVFCSYILLFLEPFFYQAILKTQKWPSPKWSIHSR